MLQIYLSIYYFSYIDKKKATDSIIVISSWCAVFVLLMSIFSNKKGRWIRYNFFLNLGFTLRKGWG